MSELGFEGWREIRWTDKVEEGKFQAERVRQTHKGIKRYPYIKCKMGIQGDESEWVSGNQGRLRNGFLSIGNRKAVKTFKHEVDC